MDATYRTANLIFKSSGITARPVDDQAAPSSFLNLENCEELAEEAIGTRLGTSIVNTVGTAVAPISGLVHTVAKLSGLNGASWRYAGAGGNLYRRSAAGTGAFTAISTTLSGSPFWAVPYKPNLSSVPTMFIADANGMLKDNGTLASPQNMGILQPQIPVNAVAQPPDQVTLDNYTGALAYNYPLGGSGTLIPYVATTLTSVVTPGINTVTVADPTQPGLFQLLTIDTGANSETVLVIQVTPTGFVANFTKAHASGVSVSSMALSMTVAASATQSVNASFVGTPIATWPTTLQQADYIGLYIFVSDPSQVQSIQLSFDCGDGSFESDFFYKVIAQGPLQSLLDTAGSNSTDATTAATDALLDQSLGLFGNSSGSIVQLNTGLNNWSPLLIQLSDFAGGGRANFTDPVFNWSAVNGYQITVVMNDGSSAIIKMSALVLFGGAGPDSFAGVAYDWLFTFYNNVDGTESNPCMSMSNVNPPLLTNWITPRRQPVLLTLLHPTVDPQTNRLRIYRRGGTLGDNYRRIDEVPLGEGQTNYLDIAADDEIDGGDFVSFENDVPVTSSLPNPVDTILTAAIATINQVVSVFPASMANISVSQQVSLGSVTATGLTQNYETVIVLTIAADHFTAYVQNTHAIGETVSATAKYAQPVTIMALAYGQMWFAGDPNNPHYLYFSAKTNPQAVSSAAYVEVGSPDDPITAIVGFKGNLYVSTVKFWYSVAPGTNAESSPTVYPTAAKHGCVAPFGWLVTEEAIYYQAVDGIRAFAGGASMYLTQGLEFLFQGVGTSPIIEANQGTLNQTRAAYWNNYLVFSYIGTDEQRHRVLYHTEYKRWRNDDVDSQSIFLEADTNTLIFGDSNGLVHVDRLDRGYDEANVAGVLTNVPISMTMQTPYLDGGTPDCQKNYNELTLDVNTAGQTVNVVLLFNDGEESLNVGTISTAERQRINLNIQAGAGYQAFKVALLLTCEAMAQVYIYQVALRSIVQARTRQSIDTYWLRQGTDSSKLCRDFYCEYDSSVPLTGQVFYDQFPNAVFTFTLPASTRQSMRVRLPAVKYRLMRIIITGAADFQVWEQSYLAVKPILQGSKGYETMPLTPDQ
jgi:hypothetical protein